MVDLINATRGQMAKAIGRDAQHERESVRKCDLGLDPWPEDWRALKDLFKDDDALINWLATFTADAVERSKSDEVNGASISAILLRSVVIGYYLAKEQMSEELERSCAGEKSC